MAARVARHHQPVSFFRLRAPSRYRLGTLALAAVPLVALTVFFLYPVAGMLARGFWPDGSFDPGAVLEVLGRPRVRRVLWFTLWSAACATLISVVAGVPVAFVLHRPEVRRGTRRPGRRRRDGGGDLLAIALRNAGSGIAVLHGWRMLTGEIRQLDHRPPEEFTRLTRDLYLGADDLGYWQGSFRDPSSAEYIEALRAIREREPFAMEILLRGRGGRPAADQPLRRPGARQERVARGGRPALEPRPGRPPLALTFRRPSAEPSPAPAAGNRRGRPRPLAPPTGSASRRRSRRCCCPRSRDRSSRR